MKLNVQTCARRSLLTVSLHVRGLIHVQHWCSQPALYSSARNANRGLLAAQINKKMHAGHPQELTTAQPFRVAVVVKQLL